MSTFDPESLEACKGPAQASSLQQGTGEAADWSWHELICVTNRHLFAQQEDFLARLAQVAVHRPRAIVLREKDLTETDYETLACEVLAICRAAGVPGIVHGFPDVARRQHAAGLHLPMPRLCRLAPAERASLASSMWLGTSCHSVAEAEEAVRLGCTYIFAGHIFATSCKPGLPPRGLDFLREVTAAVSLPVYAIGGLRPARVPLVRAAGAKGACAMGSLMQGTLWF